MDVVHTLRTLNGDPSAYIFADRSDGGYLVVSADDCAAHVYNRGVSKFMDLTRLFYDRLLFLIGA